MHRRGAEYGKAKHRIGRKPSATSHAHWRATSGNWTAYVPVVKRFLIHLRPPIVGGVEFIGVIVAKREKQKRRIDPKDKIYSPGFADFSNRYMNGRVEIHAKTPGELLKLRERVYPLAVAEKLTKTDDLHNDFEVLLEDINEYLR